GAQRLGRARSPRSTSSATPHGSAGSTWRSPTADQPTGRAAGAKRREFRTDPLLRGRPGPDVNALGSAQAAAAQPASSTGRPPSSGPGQLALTVGRVRTRAGGVQSSPPARRPERPLARPPPAGGPVLLEALASQVLVHLLPSPAASRHSSDEYSVPWEQEVCDDGRQTHPRWVPPRFAVPGYRRRQRRDRLLHQRPSRHRP